MSTDYYLVCDQHRSFVAVASNTMGRAGGAGSVRESAAFVISHKACRLRVVDEHSRETDSSVWTRSVGDDTWTDWTGEEIRDLDEPARRWELVIVESPFAAPKDLPAEARARMRAELDLYLRRAMHDCVHRYESPYASHAILTQPGVLDDDDVPGERERGMAAGRAWYARADKVVVFADYGVSSGMQAGIAHAVSLGLRVEERSIGRNEKGLSK